MGIRRRILVRRRHARDLRRRLARRTTNGDHRIVEHVGRMANRPTGRAQQRRLSRALLARRPLPCLGVVGWNSRRLGCGAALAALCLAGTIRLDVGSGIHARWSARADRRRRRVAHPLERARWLDGGSRVDSWRIERSTALRRLSAQSRAVSQRKDGRVGNLGQLGQAL